MVVGLEVWACVVCYKARRNLRLGDTHTLVSFYRKYVRDNYRLPLSIHDMEPVGNHQWRYNRKTLHGTWTDCSKCIMKPCISSFENQEVPETDGKEWWFISYVQLWLQGNIPWSFPVSRKLFVVHIEYWYLNHNPWQCWTLPSISPSVMTSPTSFAGHPL